MQGKLTSREAWTRFSTALLVETEMDPADIADISDRMLFEYLQRFPDPEDLVSARVVDSGCALEFSDVSLTDEDEVPSSEALEV